MPSTLTERIIRFVHEGPGGAHKASKATSAKILRSFWWIDLIRDVCLYFACCSVGDKFIRLGQTPRAKLRTIEVGGRGDCIEMGIYKGNDSLPETPRGNKYILTIIDCFTRFVVAVPLADQSALFIISAILGHYITIYGTTRRILTDQGKNFESQEFSNFC